MMGDKSKIEHDAADAGDAGDEEIGADGTLPHRTDHPAANR